MTKCLVFSINLLAFHSELFYNKWNEEIEEGSAFHLRYGESMWHQYRRLYGCSHKTVYNSKTKFSMIIFHQNTIGSEAYIFTKELFTNTGFVLYEAGGLHVYFKLLGVQIAPPQKIIWLFSLT